MKYEKGTFTVVPSQANLKGVNPQAQCLYMWLCYHANKDGSCFPSRRLLADECGISMSSIDRMLKLLEKNNLIKKEVRKTNDDKYYTTNLYYVEVAPQVSRVASQVHKGSPTDTQGGSPTDTHRTKPTLSNQIQLTKEAAAAALTPKQECELLFSENEELKEKVIAWLVSRGMEESKAHAELDKFTNYWTEPNPAGTKQRWQMQKTFEVRRRLQTWMERAGQWSKDGDKRTEHQKRVDKSTAESLKQMGF